MIVQFSVYIAGGLVVFALNMLYFAAIVRTKINRERYGLTGMEFFADGLMAFAIALAGMVRIVQILLENQNSTVSRIFCVVVPYNAILAWTEPMTAISMLVVSIDRLISIVKPILYYKKC
ncbi:Serpentine type 7TM GPCR chemoreceptor Srbc family protein [Brugia pahangi]